MVNGKNNKRKNGQNTRNYKNYKKAKPSNQVILRCPQVCPDIMYVQMEYTATKEFSGAGASDLIGFVFRANGIFDPDFAAGGQQPLGHDQWQAFYRRYAVYASSCKVMFQSKGENAVNLVGTIVPLNTNSLVLNKQQTIELPNTVEGPIGMKDGNNVCTLTNYSTTGKQRGNPNDVIEYDAATTAPFGSDPGFPWFWHVYVNSPAGELTWECDATITIRYYVKLYDRETLSRS